MITQDTTLAVAYAFDVLPFYESRNPGEPSVRAILTAKLWDLTVPPYVEVFPGETWQAVSGKMNKRVAQAGSSLWFSAMNRARDAALSNNAEWASLRALDAGGYHYAWESVAQLADINSAIDYEKVASTERGRSIVQKLQEEHRADPDLLATLQAQLPQEPT